MNDLIQNKKKSEVLIEAIMSLNYGDVITHKIISEIIEEPYPSVKYNSVVQKVRKSLLKDYSRCIEAIFGEGYRVVQPDDFVNQSLKHYKKGFKEIQKGSDTLTHAPVSDMTEEGKTVYRRVHDRTVILNASLQGAKVELKKLSERKHPFAVGNTGRVLT